MKTNDKGKKPFPNGLMETKLHHLVPFLPDISQCFKAIQVIEAEFKKNAITVWVLWASGPSKDVTAPHPPLSLSGNAVATRGCVLAPPQFSSRSPVPTASLFNPNLQPCILVIQT